MMEAVWRVLASLVLCSLAAGVWAAPKAELDSFWNVADAGSVTRVDHGDWQSLLDTYLDSHHPTGINRFAYAKVSAADKARLLAYLQRLQAMDPRSLNKAEQKAYWINLYNAATVNLILQHYPVKSITKLGGLFSFGPWDDEILTIAGKALSLNDVEHHILRPIWNDNRIHYALNCASLGCPNLSASAFTVANLDTLLDSGVSAYIGHARGINITGQKLVISSIYRWYQGDFAEDDAGLLKYLASHAEPALQARLQAYHGDIDDGYDWALNQP